MYPDLDDKVFLLAGASGGVGRAAARMLLEGGAKVGLHYRRNNADLQPLVKEHPGNALLVRGDFTDPDDIRAAVQQTVDAFGGLDGCLSTVGSALRMQPFLDIPNETVATTIDVELRSVIELARAVLPHLIERGGGKLILVGSDSGKVGTSGEAISAACRGAIIALAKSLAREYARQQILVNVVCPGPTDTGLWDDLVENDEFGGKIGNAMIRAIPLRRIGTAEEVASAGVFLLSSGGNFITGQAISVSGGLTMS